MSVYAVISTGGKQYRVQEGDVLKVETLEHEVGKTFNFQNVLAIGAGKDVKLGKPFLSSGTVSAEVLSNGRHDKVQIVKFRRRKHHEKWQGHRQNYTEVKITKIVA